jgi:DNA polymerase III delta prime subunit
MLTKESQNALLTTIEDPPAGAYFIFCSTDPQKILPTIRSRCYKYEVKCLRPVEMKQVLNRVITEAKLSISTEMLNLIIETSDGVPRDALTKLGMLEGVTDLDEAIDLVYKDLYDTEVIELCRLVVNKGGWKEVVSLFKGLPKTQDFEALKAIVVGYLASCLLNVKNDRKDIVRFTELMDMLIGPLDYACPKNDFLLRLSMVYLRGF